MKKTIGIIVEYNPFHLGHLKHINEIKKQFPDSIIIAAMSGNVVQRGEFAIASKFYRAILGIYHGIDIVVEIPSFHVLNNANIFAHKAIEILNDFKVEHIIFGSETSDIDNIIKKAREIEALEDQEYKDGWKENFSMPKTLEQLSHVDFKSNDILGICYVMEGNKINKNITFDAIQRETNDTYLSAHQIRTYMLEHNDFYKRFIPDNWIEKYKIPTWDNREFEIFWKYDLFTKSSVQKEISFLKNKLEQESNIALNTISSKNFTRAKLKRENMKFSLALKNSSYNKWRVLAFSDKGKEYLSNNREEINYSTKYETLYQNELRIARVLGLKYGDKTVIDEINFNAEFAYKLLNKWKNQN